MASTASNGQPDYLRLTRLLLGPLASSAEAFKVDCESHAGGQRVLVRVAMDEADRGRVFGRGGRNLEAARTVLKAAGASVAQVVNLEVFGSGSNSRRDRRGGRGGGRRPRS